MDDELRKIDIEMKIMAILFSIKLFPNIDGFDNVVEGIKLIIKNAGKKRLLYREVSRINETKREKIGFSVRNAIYMLKKNDGVKKYAKLFNLTDDIEDLSPKEFLYTIAMKVKKDKEIEMF